MRLLTIVLLTLWTALGFGQEFMRYSSVSDRNDLDILEEDPKISFDKMGIIMYDGKYDPDLVMDYSILCYERYKETNNYYYFLKLDEQCQYIFGGKSDHLYGEDAGSAVRITNDTLDVTAPRYSARVQGKALSVVLRFATKEDAPRIKKFQNRIFRALTRPVELGGMFGRTNAGLPWLEEFPGSVDGRNSLKGMLTGLIGLLEYSSVVKEDRVVKRITDELLNSLILQIGNYNDLTTVYSSTYRKKPATIGDQRELIFLFKHLYELTAEPVFLRESALIAILMGHQSSEYVRDWDLFYSNIIASKGKLMSSKIEFDNSSARKLHPQEQVKIDNGTVQDFPWYVYAKTQKLTIKTESTLTLETASEEDNLHVLYRYSWHSDQFESVPWNALSGKSDSELKFVMAPGYYQFMTIHENNGGDLPLKTNSLKSAKN